MNTCKVSEVDQEFGHNNVYWYALLCTAIHDKDAVIVLVERIRKFERDRK